MIKPVTSSIGLYLQTYIMMYAPERRIREAGHRSDDSAPHVLHVSMFWQNGVCGLWHDSHLDDLKDVIIFNIAIFLSCCLAMFYMVTSFIKLHGRVCLWMLLEQLSSRTL